MRLMAVQSNSSLMINYRSASLASILVITTLLSACHSDSGNKNHDNPDDGVSVLDQELDAIIDSKSIQAIDTTNFTVAGKQLPNIQEPKAVLGKKLFFSKALGGDMDSACASCHHPMLGGGDDLSLSIGVAAVDSDLLGPGRLHKKEAEGFDGGPTVPRNAPTIFNFAFYQKTAFHDGRIEVLENGAIRTPDSKFGTEDPKAGENLAAAQARFPVTSVEEMKGHAMEENGDMRDFLEKRLNGETGELSDQAVANWKAEFAAVYGPNEPLITYKRVAESIAAYENSQVFIDNAWQLYLKGDVDALSGAAKRGAILFFTGAESGGAGCVNCHNGIALTDEEHHVIGVPQIGRGKGDGENGRDDFGRFRETGNPDEMYAFRTPFLLNVEHTGPWGHNGAFSSLEAMVRHHINPLESLSNYDLSQIDNTIPTDTIVPSAEACVDQLERLQVEGKSKLPVVELTDSQIQDIVAFLRAQTDPCVNDRTCLSPWIPGPEDSDPDGKRLVAKDINGNIL